MEMEMKEGKGGIRIESRFQLRMRMEEGTGKGGKEVKQTLEYGNSEI